VADHLGVTSATASATTEGLVQCNFVDGRDDHPQERRRVVLQLTDAGKQHLQEARSQTRAHISTLLESLTDDQSASI
jgi:DNA-binding MarR family transcriptional regulator